LVAITLLPFVILALSRSESDTLPTTEHLRPFWPGSSEFDIGALITSLLGVLWAYHGWMNIAPVAEEVSNPRRNIPLALLCGTGIVIALYLGANLAYCLVLSQDEMKLMTDTPVVAGFSRRLLGPIGLTLASAAVMFSVFGALNGNLLVGPRLLYAMGEDGLAPRVLGAVHSRYHTPAAAILLMAGWSVVLILSVASLTELELLEKGISHFDLLTNFAMFGSVTFETLAVATIFVFRWRLPNADRPYRCPGYPVVPILYVLIISLVLINMFVNQQLVALAGVGFIALGAGVYRLTVGRRPLVINGPGTVPMIKDGGAGTS
jgi:amino acid transporter